MKKITSLSLGLSFIIMTYTGIMLFFCPHGRVAYWSDWHLLGLSKNQYGELHTTSMLTMLFFGTLHIYYNWKPILNYMKDKSKKISFTKKEFLIALSVNLFFVIGTLIKIEPFNAFLKFEENFKDSWSKQYSEPPYGHAEETKLNIFCKKVGIDLDDAKKSLDKAGIKFKESDSLLKIAQNNHTTPADIYKLIDNRTKKTLQENIPTNLGRKTLQELSMINKINLKKSMDYLKEKGIEDLSKDNKMKNIADELDTTPLELYNKLSKLN